MPWAPSELALVLYCPALSCTVLHCPAASTGGQHGRQARVARRVGAGVIAAGRPATHADRRTGELVASKWGLCNSRAILCRDRSKFGNEGE
jgi:hypothetical protein